MTSPSSTGLHRVVKIVLTNFHDAWLTRAYDYLSFCDSVVEDLGDVFPVTIVTIKTLIPVVI